MRLPTTTILSLSALAALVLTGCSTGSTTSAEPASPTTAAPRKVGSNTAASAPLSSAALSKRLLDESDLGEGYSRKPQRPATHDDVTVIGCPALAKLGSSAATGTGPSFPRKAKASFTYAGGSDSEVSEELYSDTATKLSQGIGEIFDAMTACPTYQLVSGSIVIDIGTKQTAAPDLGDEQWSQLLTYAVGGQRSVVKQTAIRTGTILVVLSGAPALVDAHLADAVQAAQAR
ncbi:hypothetical protein [Streptomyces akebiae]|uniref:Secreted protein n=1 Tax=Streptomyces akebiae TaxID=2865673 RepID=A0ABX8XLR0_9ACTN|nr:hypothetical protein [Streptomyces akebiae]QYX76489.1 hypothetical protein K1J60_08180 [Streptomyces akebiae]